MARLALPEGKVKSALDGGLSRLGWTAEAAVPT
jgi:hypothetical protein